LDCVIVNFPAFSNKFRAEVVPLEVFRVNDVHLLLSLWGLPGLLQRWIFVHGLF
jgi:hypothetical protein